MCTTKIGPILETKLVCIQRDETNNKTGASIGENDVFKKKHILNNSKSKILGLIQKKYLISTQSSDM